MNLFLNAACLINSSFLSLCKWGSICGFLLLCSCNYVFAQEGEDSPGPPKLRILAALSTNLSFTGINVSAGAIFDYGLFSVYAGPKVNLSQSYLLGKGPFGFVISGNIFPGGKEKKFSGFIHLDYQLAFLKPICNNLPCASKLSLIHEYSFGYGILWETGKRIHLFSMIGIGRYTEQFYNPATGKRFRNNGYNSLIKLGIAYAI